MSNPALRLIVARIHPMPVHAHNHVRGALAVIAELEAFRVAQQLGDFIAGRFLGGRHQLQPDEQRSFRRQSHLSLAVRPSDQQFRKLFFIAPDTRHVPYLFYRNQESRL